MVQDPLYDANGGWVRVEVFRLAHDRLPERGDNLTQETLDEFARRYDAKELPPSSVDVDWLRMMIALDKFPLLPRTDHA